MSEQSLGGVGWLCRHFKRVETPVGWSPGLIAGLFLHTMGEKVTPSDVRRWLHTWKIPIISSFKEDRDCARTPLICKTHRHVTIVLPENKRVGVWHSLDDGPLDVTVLRDNLVREQLVRRKDVDRLDFVDPFAPFDREVLNEVPEHIEQVCVKQKLKLVYVVVK